MKQAKASTNEWISLVKWLESAERQYDGVPPWRRVVFGYQALVENCCDPNSDTLDWKPEILKLMEKNQ